MGWQQRSRAVSRWCPSRTRGANLALATAGLLVTFALVLLVMPQSAEAQRAIFIVRHAEQLDDSSDSPLSEAGRQRAKALVGVLKDAGITAIYTTETQRTIQTAEPLVTALRLPAVVVPRKDTEDLIRRLRERHSQDIVLVVAHSGSLRGAGAGMTVPALLKGLGHPAEVKIGRSEYDALFVVLPKSEGPPAVLRLRY
jgi:hypothetical protein